MMAKDPEKARKRAREEFAQINIRIRAQEALVKKLEQDPLKLEWWFNATRDLKLLKEKRQGILRRMQ